MRQGTFAAFSGSSKCDVCGLPKIDPPNPLPAGYVVPKVGNACSDRTYLNPKIQRNNCKSTNGWTFSEGVTDWTWETNCLACDECISGSTESLDNHCPPRNSFYSKKTELGDVCKPISACQYNHIADTPKLYSDTSLFNGDASWPSYQNIKQTCVFTHDAMLPGSGGTPGMRINASTGPFIFVAGYQRIPGEWGYYTTGTSIDTTQTYFADVLPYYKNCSYNEQTVDVNNSIWNPSLPVANQLALNSGNWEVIRLVATACLYDIA